METLETTQARHRKEQRDLQSRITNKKKNATKKTRKGVNDECAALELDLKERHERELAALNGDGDAEHKPEVEEATEEIVTDDAAHITNKLNDTTISSTDTPSRPTPPTPPTPPRAQTRAPAEPHAQTQTQTQTQTQGGKRRNRQKERMARRAAEQEAEAEAAEEEARGMTDHRSLERASLEKAFDAHGLVEHEIRPDGHCLFSAVADQLAQRAIPITPPHSTSSSSRHRGHPDQTQPYRVVRRVATDYMEGHADDFAPFLEEPLASYVPKIRDSAEWGGQLELLALASAYRVEIKVVQDGRTETIQPSAGFPPGDEGSGSRTIWLAYYRHGYGLGEHYNSLRKKKS
ncbi:OTU domain-containing protein 6B [Xylaria sp. CBS 124048]|nr:OTU domain-containing protein 6B [Xylaria sp. CBS 124048]